MIGKLLFAVDFSPYTEHLVACAGELGAAGLRDVVLLYVLETKKHAEIGEDLNPAHEAELAKAREHLDGLSAEMEAQGLKVTRMLKTGDPAQEIIQTARDEDADIIFMGAKGKGPLDRAFLGSVSNKVLKESDRSVMIQHCRVGSADTLKFGAMDCLNVTVKLLRQDPAVLLCDRAGCPVCPKAHKIVAESKRSESAAGG